MFMHMSVSCSAQMLRVCKPQHPNYMHDNDMYTGYVRSEVQRFRSNCSLPQMPAWVRVSQMNLACAFGMTV